MNMVYKLWRRVSSRRQFYEKEFDASLLALTHRFSSPTTPFARV